MKRQKYLNYLKAGGLFGALLLGAAPEARAQANQAQLIALWDFNDASTATQSRDALRGIVGTNVATAGFTAEGGGRTGTGTDRAMDLKTAGNNYVRVANGGFINFAAANDDMTVTFWQRLYNVVASSTFWMSSPSSPSTQRGFQAHVPWSDQTIYFDSAGCCGADTRINLNISSHPAYVDVGFWTNWHHFAFVKNGPNKEIWIDGELFHSGDSASPLPLDFQELWIGATVGGGNYVRGVVDDFAVWGNALEGTHIQQLAGGATPRSLVVDTDGDGMPDWWEDQFAFNKNSAADAALDADNDGLTNLQEYQKLTDPRNPDTDGDGLRDGVETGTGIWVSANDTGTDPLKADSDGDGLSDGIETNSGVFVSIANPGTNPNRADTDGDGFSDSVEAKFGGNPVNPAINPLPTTTTKLLAWWDFNNSSNPGQTLDRLSGMLGIVTNEAFFTSGRTIDNNDQAISFGFQAGTSVLVPDGTFLNIASPSNQITISFWQRLDELAATSSLWAESAVAGRGINLHNPWSDSTIYFDTGGADAATRISSHIRNLPGYDENTWDWTAWHHYAIVKNGNTKEIWIDGKLLVRGTNTRRLENDFTRLWIGSQPNGGSPVRGSIDDFAVFASALDENRIRELAGGNRPNNIETLTDTDNDGMPDIWEIDNGLNRLVNDASADPDNDGLTNLQEFQRGTKPLVADTDGDGLLDGVETATGIFVSATNTGTNPLRADTDGDGLRDNVETGTGTFVSATNTGTDPNKADTDGDGVSDGVEIQLQTNPNSAQSTPIQPGQPNLLAWWDFNSATGDNVLDRQHGIVGVLTNSAMLGGGSSGRTGTANDQSVDLGPDSANQAVFVTNAVFLNAGSGIDRLSVSFWQRLYDVADSSSFWAVSPSAPGSRGYQGHTPWSNQNLYFDTAGCCDANVTRINRHINGLPDYDEGTWDWTAWHHFAFVKNGNNKQIWVDGKLLVEGGGIPLPTDFTHMMIGSDGNTGGSLHGQIDDFAIFASGLTAAQVAELAAGKSPTEITGAALPPTLSFSRSGAQITITFTGTLESSDTLAPGSWQPVANATSPTQVNTAAAQHRFYRARN